MVQEASSQKLYISAPSANDHKILPRRQPTPTVLLRSSTRPAKPLILEWIHEGLSLTYKNKTNRI